MNNNKKIIGILFILIGVLILSHNLNIEMDVISGAILILIGVFCFLHYKKNAAHLWILLMGVFLALMGVSFILDMMFHFPDNLIGALFLTCISVAFFTIHFHKINSWWAAIPGGIFFILAAIVVVDAFHLLKEDYFGFIIFSGISLIFWYLYLINDEQNKTNWAKYPAIALSIISIFILHFSVNTRVTDLLIPLSIIIVGLYLVIKHVLPRHDT